jgi:hypothetical protein
MPDFIKKVASGMDQDSGFRSPPGQGSWANYSFNTVIETIGDLEKFSMEEVS